MSQTLIIVMLCKDLILFSVLFLLLLLMLLVLVISLFKRSEHRWDETINTDIHLYTRVLQNNFFCFVFERSVSLKNEIYL